jgi:hypothetical protein
MRLLVPAAAAFASFISTASACPWHHDRAAAAPPPPASDPWASPSGDGEDEAALAPPSAAPVVAPAPAMTPVAEDDQGWCHHHGAWKHARWNWRNYEPRFAVGYAKGHLDLRDTDDEVTQKSLIGRVVLHHGFEVELELSKIEDGGDTTHTHGAALLKTFGHHHLRPYVLAGFGAGSIDRADGSEPDLRYAEFGGGLMLKGRHLAIGVDLRKGVRKVEADAMVDAAARMETPSDEDKQHYTRGRVMALVYF